MSASIEPTQVSGYYRENSLIYKEGTAEEKLQQDQAYRAMGYAIEIIRDNSKATERSKTWTESGTSSEEFIRDHIFLWLSLHVLERSLFYNRFPSDSSGCCSGGGSSCNCSGGGNGGDGCVIVMLVLAIIALVAATAIVFGVTVYEGCDADATRQKIDEIKELKEQASEQKVKDTYQSMIPILQGKYAEKSVSTLSTAVITVGLGVLTAAAIMALYGVILKAPISPLASTLAMAGGGAVGVGFIAHLVNHVGIHLLIRDKAKLALYEDLYRKMCALNDLVVNPYEILNASSLEKAYLATNGVYFIKDGATISHTNDPKGKLSAEFIQLEVRTKFKHES